MVEKFGKIFFISILLPFSVLAQMNQSDSPAPETVVNIRDEKQNRKSEVKAGALPGQKRDLPIRRLSFLKHKRSKEQQKRLLPNAEDLTRYAAFLQQPKTGIIRLVDDIGCDSNAYVLRADKECLSSIPGGSFYSFREREYSSSALSDIRFKSGLLISDGVLSQNILVSLSDSSLENLTTNSDGIKFLTNFVPETDNKGATNQYIKITKGIRNGKFEYLKVFPAIVNTTYAMRIIAYRGKFLRMYRGFIYDALSGNNRVDLIVAFRIIRKENDSITLIWKELERKKAPKIVNSANKNG